MSEIKRNSAINCWLKHSFFLNISQFNFFHAPLCSSAWWIHFICCCSSSTSINSCALPVICSEAGAPSVCSFRSNKSLTIKRNVSQVLYWLFSTMLLQTKPIILASSSVSPAHITFDGWGWQVIHDAHAQKQP